MIKSSRAVVLILAMGAFGLVVATGVYLSSRSSPSSPAEPTAIQPTQIDPAMTTEQVPQLRDDGVVPAPSDAVGEGKPEPTKEAATN